MARMRDNWHAEQTIGDEDLDHFDIFCFVKRPIPKMIEKIHRLGKPVVFDVVDSWSQPDDHDKVANAQDAQDLFADKWKELPPFTSYIFANRKMHADLGGLASHSTYIYHHHREDLSPNPVNETVRTVGYEGNEAYLGQWREVLEELCHERGLRFVVNPPSVADLDIGIACRGAEHAGYLSNAYKSNVKLANLYGAGTPALVSADDYSYHETDCGDVLFFSTAEQLAQQLDRLMDVEYRRTIHHRFLQKAPEFSIQTIADTFEQYFLSVLRLHRDGRLA